MFDVDYLLFCAGKSTDDNGNLSLHGIFEFIYAQDFPVRHQPFLIVFRLTAKKPIVDQQLKMKISVELDGKETNGVDIDGKFTAEKGNGITPSINVSQFVFPEAGSYDIKLLVEGKLLATRRLKVRPVSELSEK